MSETLYTYRGGQRVPLKKQPNQFVVRALPGQIATLPGDAREQVSSASTRVVVSSDELDPVMDRARTIAPTHHAYARADTQEAFLITDRVFITFGEGTTEDDVDALAGKYGLLLLDRYSDRDYLFRLTDQTGMNPVKLVVKLTEDEPLVTRADHDLNVQARKYEVEVPDDPQYLLQWHLHQRLDNPEVDPRSSSRCEEAWQLLDSFGDSEVVVGITDDGCKLDHPDFDGEDKFAGWGYLRGTRLINDRDVDAEPAAMYKPGANHGTSCAGVTAGEVDGVLTVGAAPGCRLFPVQWESQGPSLFISDSKFLTVLNYLADKVDIISNSWGVTPISEWVPLVTDKITELAEVGGRRGSGILFLFAAGNENCPINYESDVDIPYTPGWNPSFTAWVGVQTARTFRNNLVGIPGVMHVAALASNAQRSHYSNYGPGMMLTAPTSNSHSYFRTQVPGLGITTTTGDDSEFTQRFGGTSSATPLVAGVAALVISANPSLSGYQVADLLRETAAKDLNFTGYERTPPATYDPDTSWDVSPVPPFDQGEFQDGDDDELGSWSPWFGYGKADALMAVSAALTREKEANAVA